MAVGAITTVLLRLIIKHGITKGIKIAQKLGFKNHSLKSAFKALNNQQKKIGLKEFKRKPKTTFGQRKYERIGDRAYKAERRELKRMIDRDPDLTGTMH